MGRLGKDEVRAVIGGAFGWLCIGLGLYAVYAGEDVFHGLLRNMEVVIGLMVLGLAFSLWEAGYFFNKARRTRKKDEHDAE